MKHQEFIDEIFTIFHEWWMDDADKKTLKEMLLKEVGTDEQELSDSIDVGIRNGYSLEAQMKLIRTHIFQIQTK